MKGIKLNPKEQAIEDLELRPVTGQKRQKIEATIRTARQKWSDDGYDRRKNGS